jgi:hypothetical protein
MKRFVAVTTVVRIDDFLLGVESYWGKQQVFNE